MPDNDTHMNKASLNEKFSLIHALFFRTTETLLAISSPTN
jgi:hypothetical protein